MNLIQLLQLSQSYEAQLPPFKSEYVADATNLAAMIDHTLLKPEATPAQVETLCTEAVQYHFAAVCVNPIYVNLVSRQLAGSRVATCTVVGFPLGAVPAQTRAFETRQAVESGAAEIDLVIPVGLLRAGEAQAVFDHIAAVVMAAKPGRALVKVIIETALLTRAEKILACLLSREAGANFVKTSTGFASGGATAEDVTLMRCVVGLDLGVKASGGVRSLADARAMVAAGASRLGTSSGVKIIQESQYV